jgi:hypothetical protein
LDILAKMLAKAPDERFQSAAEVCEALTPFAHPQPIAIDFPGILSARAAEARQRRAAQLKRDARSAAASSIIRASATGLSGRQFAANVESMTGGDTQPSRAPKRQAVPRIPPVVASAAIGAATVPDTQRPSAADVRLSESVLVAADRSTRIPLTTPRIVIGRQPDCDIQLASTAVSSKHCELSFDGNWWRVTALASKNGIQVNGVEVQNQMLWPGDRLTIARQYHFLLEYRMDREERRAGRKYLWPLAAMILAAAVWAALSFWLA